MGSTSDKLFRGLAEACHRQSHLLLAIADAYASEDPKSSILLTDILERFPCHSRSHRKSARKLGASALKPNSLLRRRVLYRVKWLFKSTKLVTDYFKDAWPSGERTYRKAEVVTLWSVAEWKRSHWVAGQDARFCYELLRLRRSLVERIESSVEGGNSWTRSSADEFCSAFDEIEALFAKRSKLWGIKPPRGIRGWRECLRLFLETRRPGFEAVKLLQYLEVFRLSAGAADVVGTSPADVARRAVSGRLDLNAAKASLLLIDDLVLTFQDSFLDRFVFTDAAIKRSFENADMRELRNPDGVHLLLANLMDKLPQNNVMNKPHRRIWNHSDD